MHVFLKIRSVFLYLLRKITAAILKLHPLFYYFQLFLTFIPNYLYLRHFPKKKMLDRHGKWRNTPSIPVLAMHISLLFSAHKQR